MDSHAIHRRLLQNDSVTHLSPDATGVHADPARQLDVQYVEMAAKGDNTAFAYLFETRSVKISKYLYSLLSNGADVEEAVAEVFVTAWRKLRKLRQPERFDAWLFRIAYNQAMDTLRKRKKTEPLDGSAMSKPDTNPHHSPQDSLELDESQRMIRNALLQLPEEQREVLTLRFLASMSHAEVAAQLGKSVEAVRALQYRALKSLRP